MPIRKIKGSLVRLELNDYVGELSYLFHDVDTGELRICDGTPGGSPVGASGGTGIFSLVQLTGGTGNQGEITWNANEETLDVVTNGATLQLGQEMHIHCRNSTGVTITNGTPVMAVGTVGASGRILISSMDGTDPANAKFFLGITTEDIPNGDDGKVTSFGKIRSIDTSGTPYGETWAEGDVIWVSATTIGYLTNVEPIGAQLGLAVAFLISVSAVTGTLFVRVTNTDDHAYAPISQAILTGAGSPEGVVTAVIGRLYTSTTGGAGTTLYVKESGTGNTGWIAK